MHIGWFQICTFRGFQQKNPDNLQSVQHLCNYFITDQLIDELICRCRVRSIIFWLNMMSASTKKLSHSLSCPCAVLWLNNGFTLESQNVQMTAVNIRWNYGILSSLLPCPPQFCCIWLSSPSSAASAHVSPSRQPQTLLGEGFVI